MSSGAAPGLTAAAGAGVNWADWSVILLKPDCVDRRLVEPVLGWISEHTTIVDIHEVQPTRAQIFAHYDDMLPRSRELGRDVPAELCRIYVDRTVVIALAHGPDATARIRALIGPTDPAIAPATTVRGRFAADTLARAVAEARLVDNLIHTSDHPGVVQRDLHIWYGRDADTLLGTPTGPW